MLHQQSFCHHQILNQIPKVHELVYMVSHEARVSFIPQMQSNSRIDNIKSLPVSFDQGILISRSKIEDDHICNLMDARNIAANQEIVD